MKKFKEFLKTWLLVAAYLTAMVSLVGFAFGLMWLGDHHPALATLLFVFAAITAIAAAITYGGDGPGLEPW